MPCPVDIGPYYAALARLAAGEAVEGTALAAAIAAAELSPDDLDDDLATIRRRRYRRGGSLAPINQKFDEAADGG